MNLTGLQVQLRSGSRPSLGTAFDAPGALGCFQPNYDLNARCSEISAACATEFPKAAIQQAAEALADAAASTRGSEAQIAPFRIGAGVKCIGPPAIGTLVSMEVPTIVCPSLLRVWLYVY